MNIIACCLKNKQTSLFLVVALDLISLLSYRHSIITSPSVLNTGSRIGTYIFTGSISKYQLEIPVNLSRTHSTKNSITVCSIVALSAVEQVCSVHIRRVWYYRSSPFQQWYLLWSTASFDEHNCNRKRYVDLGGKLYRNCQLLRR